MLLYESARCFSKGRPYWKGANSWQGRANIFLILSEPVPQCGAKSRERNLRSFCWSIQLLSVPTRTCNDGDYWSCSPWSMEDHGFPIFSTKLTSVWNLVSSSIMKCWRAGKRFFSLVVWKLSIEGLKACCQLQAPGGLNQVYQDSLIGLPLLCHFSFLLHIPTHTTFFPIP